MSNMTVDAALELMEKHFGNQSKIAENQVDGLDVEPEMETSEEQQS